MQPFFPVVFCRSSRKTSASTSLLQSSTYRECAPTVSATTIPCTDVDVNLHYSSVYATLPFANMPTTPKDLGAWSYLASKAAASQLTRVLSNKLKADHVNVNAIAPGFFPSSKWTESIGELQLAIQMEVNGASADVSSLFLPPLDMTASGSGGVLDRSHPAGRSGTPEDIAGPAMLLSGRGGAHLTGVILTTDGGMTMIRLDSLPREIAQLHFPSARKLPSDVLAKAKL
jgi:hypothetical protein